MKTFECEFYDGCSYSSTINGTELVDLSEDEINNVLIPLLVKLIGESNNLESRMDNYVSLKQNSDEFIDFLQKNISVEDESEYYIKSGKEFENEFTIEKLKELVGSGNHDLAILQGMFTDLLVEFGDYTDNGYCEQCGSYNSSYHCVVEV